MLRTLLVLLALAGAVFAQDAKAILKTAQAKWKDGDLAGAVADLTKAMELDPALKLHRARGDLKRALHDYEGALADFKVAADAGDPDARVRRAQVFRNMGDYESAEKELSVVLAAHTQYAGGYLERAETRAILGKWKDAASDLEVAKYLEQANAQPLTRYHFTAAFVKIRQGDVAGALVDLDQVVKASPQSAGAHMNRGLLLFDTGKFKASLSDFRRAYDLDPATHEYARLYACLARTRVGEKDTAAATLAKYLDGRKVKDDWYAKVAGFLSGSLGAEDLFAEAAKGGKWEVREQTCEAHWYVGAMTLAAGDTDRAKKHFEQCVQFGLHEFIETRSAVLVLKSGG